MKVTMAAIAVDTNVLVRLATGDSAVEHVAAETLVANNSVFVPTTVLLETEWVLRSRYGYSQAQFRAYVRWLIQERNVEFDNRELVLGAVELHELGFDLADAMHLIASAGRPFATFDLALIRRARSRRIPIRAMGKK
ncbi:MAG: type II toxin-antitoxin system VapC family toxin [Gammaproteobacteria bacterium]